MMDTTALIEHLNAALDACETGHLEQALSVVLAVYEQGHFRVDFAPFLKGSEDEIEGFASKFEDTLRSSLGVLGVQRSEPLGMSISDFFDEAPAQSEVFVDDSMDMAPEQMDDMISIDIETSSEESFSFADLGGELSFENLDFSFEEGADEQEDLLDDIWPDDSMMEDMEDLPAMEDLPEMDSVSDEPEPEPVHELENTSGEVLEPELDDAVDAVSSEQQSDLAASFDGFFDELEEQAQWFSADQNQSQPQTHDEPEQDPSEAFELIEIPPVLVESPEPQSVFTRGISGKSETLDDPIAFDAFQQQQQQQQVEEKEPEPKVIPPKVVPPTHHEPEASPELHFSFAFDDEESEGANVVSEPKEVPSVKADDPATVAVLPETYQQEVAGGMLDFDDLDLSPSSPPQSQEPSEPVTRHVQDAPTRQVDPALDDIGSLLMGGNSDEESEHETSSGMPMSDDHRETVSMPAVDRSKLDPFAREPEPDPFGGGDDDWAFDQGPSVMPGLQDDWLEQPAPEEPMSARDVHNDATAIPGLNASNSGLPFNPYRHDESKLRQSSGSSAFGRSSGGNTSGGFAPPRIDANSSNLHETRENEQVYSSDLDKSVPPAVKPPEPDPFDDMFDLGLSQPEPARSAPKSKLPLPPAFSKPSPPKEEPQETVGSTMYGAPVVAPLNRSQSHVSMNDMPTPFPPSVDSSLEEMSEDEFFQLAESIAAENSVAAMDRTPKPLYRGEPVVDGPSRPSFPTAQLPSVESKPAPNPFQPLRGTDSQLQAPSSHVSFALEEVVQDELAAPPIDDDKAVLNRAQRAYDNGNYEDALDLASSLLATDFGDQARALILKIEEDLERLQLERLGSLARIPVLDVMPDKLSSLSLDHRAGFLISQIDGFLTFEDLLDLSAMPRLETMVVLADLLDRDIIKAY